MLEELKLYLANIANAIRSKLGTTDKVNAQDFADKANEVYDKGRNDEWSDFWDVFQENGNRTNYKQAFYSGSRKVWNSKTFNPKYDIVPTQAQRFLYYSGDVDLVEVMKKNGITIDFSKSLTMDFAFSDCNATRLPVIDCSSVTSTADNNGYLFGTFAYMPYLTDIEKIVVSEKIKSYVNWMVGDTCLKHLVMEGVIVASVSFSSSPLTVESMKSVISCLKNFKDTDYEATYKITFSSTCWEALEASTSPYEDGVTDNESFTWQEYVNNLGWQT